MDLSNLRYDDANYMLRTGRASSDDARRYVEVWNVTKCSTTATLIEVRDRGIRHVEIVVVET